MDSLVVPKIFRLLKRKSQAFLGSTLYPLEHTLQLMSARPFELHLELTNICNAKCVFCPYPLQQRAENTMSDDIFYRAVNDFIRIGGGRVGLTPIVGDSLIDERFLERVIYLREQSCIREILLTTNGILLDRFGIDAILKSGLSEITISTSGFDSLSYSEIYRSTQYERMRKNVALLVKRNAETGNKVKLKIAFRSYRSENQLLSDPDFQEIKKFNPELDIALAFSNGGERIKELIPPMKFRRSRSRKTDVCVNLYHGPTVLWDGTVMACFCMTAMDAGHWLEIGNITKNSLFEIWTWDKLKEIRSQFSVVYSSLCELCRQLF
jgi:MoaA/NifB/PqqE/SkfB family radical SAM enzyme